MSFFSKILEKIGLKKDKDKPASTAATTAGASKPVAAATKPAASTISRPQKEGGVHPHAEQKVAAPAPIEVVDVVANLEKMAAANPAQLNWKTSIVDLLKLLDLDSSFDARKELATELDCPADMMGDSAKMNTWLHKEVLKRIAQNGGNIPKELLDA